MLRGTAAAAITAKRLRRQMSPPEVLLWQRLRQKPLGLRFRRQHPAGPYVADFYCHEARLIIEVDGDVHDMGDNPDRDELRDAWFRQRGIEVLRIPAAEIFADPDAVAEAIAARAQSPLHQPAAGHPRPAGEA